VPIELLQDAVNLLEGAGLKICSDDELRISVWTGQAVGAAPTRCGVCLR